jgi:hypothetical protein
MTKKKVKLDPAQPLDGGKPNVTAAAMRDAPPPAQGNEPWADQEAVEPGHPAKLTNASDVKRYVLAGKATITLKSLKTGTRYTYRINQKTNNDGTKTPHFVSVMFGPDNTTDFLYMGSIFEGSKYRHTKNSKVQENDVRERAFCYVWLRVLDGLLPSDVEVWHSGTCGRCGRKLTVPESIANGIGPECATKEGV